MILKVQGHSWNSLPTNKWRAHQRCKGVASCTSTTCLKWCFARSALIISVHNSETVFTTHLVELRLSNLILLTVVSILVLLHVVRIILHYFSLAQEKEFGQKL